MEQQKYDNNMFEMRTMTLMKRLHSIFEEANMILLQSEHNLVPHTKLRCLMMIAEIYDYIGQFSKNRKDHLSEYFKAQSLKECLQLVAEVEELQNEIAILHMLFDTYSVLYSPNSRYVSTENNENTNFNLLDYYKKLNYDGINAIVDFTPSISHSLLWNANDDKDYRYKFGKLFYKAKEKFDDPEPSISTTDPETIAYTNAIHEKGLSSKVAKKTQFANYCNKFSDGSQLGLVQCILDIQCKAEETSSELLCNEFGKALEMLRNVFMTDAEDIYYIRTGDYSNLEKIYSKDVINHYYNELPFTKYESAKKDFKVAYNEQLNIDLDVWRVNHKYTGRKLKTEEYNEFLLEKRESVVSTMMRYGDLWTLRLHSGGLDTDVTPENFARMLYRRKDVDNYFIHLQWELEEITSKIEENNKEKVEVCQTEELTPEQTAVRTFVDKVIMVADAAYQNWNNKRVIPAVHKPEVHIVIKKEDLILFLQNMIKNNYDELLDICYPETSKSKLQFCKFVVQLQHHEEKFFGQLPNKLLAKVLAPIVGLSIGTTTNYLSH